MEYLQSHLFSATEAIDIITRDGAVKYQPGWLSPEESDRLFEYLRDTLDWQQRRIFIFGERRLQPRLIVFLGKSPIQYRYSGDTLTALTWPKEIVSIAEKLSSELNKEFNAVLLNYYRSGEDSMGWHADNEIELGVKPVIASLTLGNKRKFKLRHKDGEQRQLDLEHGSLLTMSGDCQQFWQHSLPKTNKEGGRINLTFRKIIEGSS